MEKYKMILEGLREGKKELYSYDIEKENSCVDEPVEWEQLWFEEEVPLDESGKIDEASAVTFGGRSYPREGWALIMAGGSGSGKGFVISKIVLIDAKIIDVDHLKNLYNKLKGMPYDLKNPDDVAKLHATISAKGWKDEVISQFFTANQILANVIFDITGKSLSSLQNYTRMTKELGYQVSFIWVITNRQVALVRNLLRDRVVPQQHFHQIHNQVNDTVLPFLKDPHFARFVDEAWVVFSGPAQAEIEAHKNVTVRSPELKNRAFKLIRRGQAFTSLVKDRGETVDIAGRILDWLGPEEVDYEDPKVYKTYADIKKGIDSLEKDEKGKPVPGQKFSALADDIL